MNLSILSFPNIKPNFVYFMYLFEIPLIILLITASKNEWSIRGLSQVRYQLRSDLTYGQQQRAGWDLRAVMLFLNR